MTLTEKLRSYSRLSDASFKRFMETEDYKDIENMELGNLKKTKDLILTRGRIEDVDLKWAKLNDPEEYKKIRRLDYCASVSPEILADGMKEEGIDIDVEEIKEYRRRREPFERKSNHYSGAVAHKAYKEARLNAAVRNELENPQIPASIDNKVPKQPRSQPILLKEFSAVWNGLDNLAKGRIMGVFKVLDKNELSGKDISGKLPELGASTLWILSKIYDDPTLKNEFYKFYSDLDADYDRFKDTPSLGDEYKKRATEEPKRPSRDKGVTTPTIPIIPTIRF